MPQLDARRDSSENEWIASCPRCGYSQRGAIEAWQDTCPLEGCCTECGLTFAWTDVLRPNLREPRWCFEYARRSELLPVPRLGPTIVRSFWPYLRRLLEDQDDMEDEKSKRLQRRLDTLMPAVNAPPPTVNMSYAVAIREAVLTPWSSRTRGFVVGWGGSSYPAPRRLHLWLGQNRAAKRLGPAALGLAAGFGLIVLMPVSFVLLPASRHKAKVRWGHVVNGMPVRSRREADASGAAVEGVRSACRQAATAVKLKTTSPSAKIMAPSFCAAVTIAEC